MAEFAYINSIHSSTKVFPSLAYYGFHPRFSISTPKTSVNPSAERRAHTLEDLYRDLALEVRAASKQYKAQVDRHRLVAPTFAIGDRIWLLCHHIVTTRPYAKLDYKTLAPFCIVERINPITFRLALPPTFRLHNVSMSLSSNSTILLAFRDDNLPCCCAWNY